MPIFERSPAELTGATINVIDEDEGVYCLKWVQPEDVVSGIAQGLAPSELAESLNLPINVIEHVIMQIPMMMSWREKRLSEIDWQESSLPVLPEHEPHYHMMTSHSERSRIESLRQVHGPNHSGHVIDMPAPIHESEIKKDVKFDVHTLETMMPEFSKK